MKKLFYSFFIFLFLSASWTQAQEKKLTIKDAVIGQWTSLYPENISQLQWIPGTDEFIFAENNSFIKASVKNTQVDTMLKLESLNKIASLPEDRQFKRLPRIKWLSEEVIAFKRQNTYYKVNPFSRKLLDKYEFSGNARNQDYCQENNHFAYTIENNLYLASFKGDTKQITKEENKDIVFGQEVHRREFGIHTGTFWSPEGNKLAFYKKDESMVTDYPLVDITQRIAELKNIKYPMAGMKSHHVKLGVYDMDSEKITYLKTGKPLDHYLTCVTWGPNEEFIYIAILNRDQDHMKLNKYDAESGELVKTLFEEKHKKYVEPQYPLQFLPNDDEKFIWFSRRDGYNHLYLYNTSGELIQQITKGKWEVTSSKVHFDENVKNVFFTSTKESPIERHFYKARIKNGKITKLTSEPGYHSPSPNSTCEYFIDNYSNTETPRIINICDKKGNIEKQLLRASNPLVDYNLGDTEISTIKTEDGSTDLYYRLIKPADFDPDKKYPAIIYVYGGPHAQLIHNRWLGGARMWNYFMSQKGYVMLTIDNRGSANRGLEFENIIHRNLGKHELSDQMQGVQLLKDLGYVDTNRIGVHGWSYGGFMTTSMMLKKPGTFKAGVAGGPVIDWKYYEVMYGERYMDTPQDNPEGYKKTNLKNYVTNLEGDLLIINGYLDDVVVPQHSLSFLRECIKKGVQVDYFTYPRHPHNVRGKDRIHLMQKVTEYFDENL